jgi:pimeloyl-ACP methyl ester carboxylesterase
MGLKPTVQGRSRLLAVLGIFLLVGCDSGASSSDGTAAGEPTAAAPAAAGNESAAAAAEGIAAGVESDNDPVSVEESLLPGVRFHQLDSNGISMRVADMGAGPVVLLAHGWPESWYSWRHQLEGLAAAGYRVLAPDMRGYGETDAPPAVEDYNLVTLAADMVGILDALEIEQATMVGHDWGSPVAAHTVLLHPERFNALVLMSVPYGGRGPANPMQAMRARTGDNFFYMLYHNEPGVAEAEYDADPRGLLLRLYQSPDAEREPPEVTDPKRAAGGWIPRLGKPVGLPDWLTEADLDYYVGQFEAAGFRGGVNYYRNFERNWQLTEDLTGVSISVPTLFIAGAQDMVIGGANQAALQARMAGSVSDLRGVILFDGVGHWVQQEAPEATNAAMIDFLRSL